MVTIGDSMDEEKKAIETEPTATVTTPEETKQNMAKVYGINLNDIEEVILPNGKEYFKFYNPEDKSLRMIENRRDSNNLSEQFKAIQQTLASSQSENERQNAKAVFDYQLKYQNIELQLIPIRNLKGNKTAYKHLFDALPPDKKKAVRVLIENMEYLDLQYINVENAVGIDSDNNVLVASYDAVTGKCELEAAQVKNYETGKINTGSEEYSFEISDEEFDAAIEQINVDFDTPTIASDYETSSNQKATVIHGREVNLEFALQAYRYPEIIDRGELSDIDKKIYHGIIAAIHRKVQKALSLTKEKQYVLKPNKPNQAAFVDSILLALLLGFCSGLLMMLVYLSIKSGI